ncbi:MAG: cell division protein FtsL [Zoogloeaceae bacterium]|jgi:cell division protein FtsL|nr:cell division protein FtsL [Zoogloeaceae bacterium]
MLRLNKFLLLFLALASALGTVASQNKARQLYQLLEAEQERARQLDVEYDLLQLELSTWATHARIEDIARKKLKMVVPVLNMQATAVASNTDGATQ